MERWKLTSPLVNEVAVAMFLGSFGLKVTLIYVVSGILLGVIGGFVLGRMRLAPYLSDWVKQIQAHSSAQADEWEKDHTTFIRRLPAIVRDAWRIVRGVLVYILIGIGIGAFMHGFVPEGFFEQYMSKDNWLAVPLSVLLAVPMYANAAGIVPVIEVFVAKGIPMGTAIAFMMAVVGLSLPECGPFDYRLLRGIYAVSRAGLCLRYAAIMRSIRLHRAVVVRELCGRSGCIVRSLYH